MTQRQHQAVTAATDLRVEGSEILFNRPAAWTRPRRKASAAGVAREAMQPLEKRQMMSATAPAGIAYDGSTLELRGNAGGNQELRVELDSDASHVRGVVDHRAGEWLRVKSVRKISVIGGDDRDTLQVDARLANTKVKLSTDHIERLKAVPVLLTPRVRMAQWAQLEAADFGKRLAGKLHVKYAGLAELTQAQTIKHVTNKSEPKPIITALSPQATPTAQPVDNAEEATADEPLKTDEPAEEQTAPEATVAPETPAVPQTPPPQAQHAQQPAADATAPLARITAMSADIPAGQAIHVDALTSELRHGEWNDASFEWDFGDGGSAFNKLRGFVGSHFYADAGTYDVRLKVTDETGRVGTTTLRVNVRAADRRQIFVSGNGNDANDGANSGKAVKSVGRALELLEAAGNHAALLFRGGQSFDLAQSIRVNHNDVVVRSYGGGRATLRWTGEPGQNPRMVFNDSGTRLLTVRDLNFETTGPGGTGKDRATAFGPVGNETAFLNNTVGDVTNVVLLNAAPKGTLVQGNQALKATGLRAYFVWGEGQNITVLGNTAVNSTREHILRFAGVRGVTVAGNDFRNMDRRGSDLQDYDKNVITMQRGSFGYVTDNKIHGPSELGPLGDGDGLGMKETRWDWAIWENNTFDVRELTVVHGTNHADIRYNLFRLDDKRSITIEGYAANYGRTDNDITIHGNVAVNNGTQGEFLRVNAGAREVEVTDNVYVAPHLQIGAWNASGMTIDDANLDGFVRISDNTWPSPSRGIGWVEGGVNHLSGHGDERDWYDAAEWNALPKVWGEIAQDVDAAPLVTAVLNRYGVPVTQQAA